MNNVSPNLKARGTILPSRFVKLSTGFDNSALPAGDNERVVGVSQAGTRDAPGVAGASGVAADDGDEVQVFGLGDICLLQAGTGGFVHGDRLKSDAVGRGVPVATTGTVIQNVGAYALETTPAAAFGRVQIVIYSERPE